MAIPSRTEAAQLLRDLDPPDWLLKHSAAVADIAAFLSGAFWLFKKGVITSLILPF